MKITPHELCIVKITQESNGLSLLHFSKCLQLCLKKIEPKMNFWHKNNMFMHLFTISALTLPPIKLVRFFSSSILGQVLLKGINYSVTSTSVNSDFPGLYLRSSSLVMSLICLMVADGRMKMFIILKCFTRLLRFHSSLILPSLAMSLSIMEWNWFHATLDWAFEVAFSLTGFKLKV